MLANIKLLVAIGEIEEEYVFDTIKALHLLGNTHHRQHASKKTWRFLVLAAVIAAILTACAVGYTIHQRRQMELRDALQIEKNAVEGYTEYAETDAEAAQSTHMPTSDIAPHIQLLSSIQQGENQLIYFSITPVTEVEVQNFLYDSFVTAFVSIAGNTPIPEACWMNDAERATGTSKTFADPVFAVLNTSGEPPEAARSAQEADPEQIKATIMSRCYDAETQSLMLQSYVSRNRVDFSKPVYFSVRCLDFRSMRIPGEEYHVTDHPTAFELRDPVYSHDYGTSILQGEETPFASVRLPAPILIENPATGEKPEVLQVRVSATCAEWTLRHDHICENPVEWYDCYNELINCAYFTFVDGSTMSLTRSPWVTFEGVHTILYTEWQGTIDITKAVQICIMGEQYSISLAMLNVRQCQQTRQALRMTSMSEGENGLFLINRRMKKSENPAMFVAGFSLYKVAATVFCGTAFFRFYVVSCIALPLTFFPC